MRYYSLLTGLLVIFIAGSATGQNSCPDIIAADLERVIAKFMETGDNPQVPTVMVSRFRPVCRAQHEQRDRYRHVSVVVEYNCTGNAECPTGNVFEQFESGCSNANVWTGLVGSTALIRTTNPLANFTTTARDDCALCFSNAVADTFSVVTDNFTHCVACNATCNEGLMRCTGRLATDCCQYFDKNNQCVDECPVNFIPEATSFNCICPPGVTGPNCSMDCPQNCSNCDSNVASCDVCVAGYTLRNNLCVCPVARCTRCTTPAICEECETGYILVNNECVCPINNCGNCSSGTSQCDRCSTEYPIFDPVSSQCIADCRVNNCSKCNRNPDMCTECDTGFKLSNGQCVCAVTNCDTCSSDVNKCDKCNKDYPTFDDTRTECVVGGGGGGGGGGGKGLSVGAIIGIIIAAIVAAIIAAAIVIAILVLIKIHRDRIALKSTELEAKPSSEHLNPMYVQPTDLVDKGPTEPIQNGTGAGGAEATGE